MNCLAVFGTGNLTADNGEFSVSVSTLSRLLYFIVWSLPCCAVLERYVRINIVLFALQHTQRNIITKYHNQLFSNELTNIILADFTLLHGLHADLQCQRDL